MINKDNDNTDQEKNDREPEKTDKPDEHPGIAVQGFLKIFDPESGEVLVQGRV